MVANNTLIEVTAPASLPLGLARLTGEHGPQVCLLGVTLQYPPVNLTVEPGRQLTVTGARANIAVRQAAQFLNHHRLPHKVDIKIELAIPGLVGLGSETMLGLSVARGLAWLHDMPLDDTLALARALDLSPQHALDVWGFDQGGLLCVGLEAAAGAVVCPVVRREVIAHAQKQHDWVFVFYLPKVPAETSAALEIERLAALQAAAPHLDSSVQDLTEGELLPALAQDDLPMFARALLTLQQHTQHALEHVGMGWPLTPEEQQVVALMQQSEAVAWGRSPTGLGLFALVRGASASVELRKRLRAHLGVYGGTIRAAITDNDGARHTFRPIDPRLAAARRVRGPDSS